MRNLKSIVQILKKPGIYMCVMMTLHQTSTIFYAGNNQKDKFEPKANDCPVKLLLDSGATVNLLDSAAFDNLLNKPCLRKSNTKIFHICLQLL